jgi:hypothetical protein
MTTSKHWKVDVYIDEHDGRTRAEARLHHPDGPRRTGHGWAKRNPEDSDVAEIGDELAAARALSDLAAQLLQATSSDIEAITHEGVHLTR